LFWHAANENNVAIRNSDLFIDSLFMQIELLSK